MNDLFEDDEPEKQKSRRKQSGITTSNLLFSSHHSDNSFVFPLILKQHVPEGTTIADITYGKGVFWRRVDRSKYKVLTTDIADGVDCKKLPYEDASLGAMVFDPPYIEGFYRRDESHLAGEGTHAAFRNFYSNGDASEHPTLKYHDRVVDMYMLTAIEAKRVLKPEGIFIVKCQDEVSANRQKLTHVEIIYGYEGLGFYCKDLFVVTRNNRPIVTKLLKQEHARKNHSYFLVFVKEKKKPRYKNCSKLVQSYWES